jgi:RimJ/RimL family protein N-acetyltransferase
MTRSRRQKPTPKPRELPRGSPVAPDAVALRPGKGSSERGGSPGGRYWHVDVCGKRAGCIFINIINDDDLGAHPSIQIHLNTTMRGRGVGRIAYRHAALESHYDVVYAHMRKSNIASENAASAAGFVPLDQPDNNQLTMVWHRPHVED